MRRTIATLAMLVTLSACQPANSNSTTETSASEPTTVATLAATLPDCEDVEGVTPCYTFDEGEWRVVESYSPYRAITLPECATEDSDNCYWDAASQGNGKGRNFITVNGQTTYL
ncbi:hypothetical protein [Micromonospora sp. CB01531]|uniref:hypothetical protein n=1 Tax=Micromonospora sp. CB01531 TaxID=1718947 RepID=UPI00093D8047|nr:hypothetical protein [Micromonospora sp. CB01531]OKI54528.1 hypothetical protein A6A27_31885 [Micromonospora sp. CB01531]